MELEEQLEEDDGKTPSWVGQLFKHVRSLFNVDKKMQERQLDYEADVKRQMYQHFRDTLPNVDHPPIFALFDVYTCKRVARSNYSISRYGDLEQPHMVSGVYSSAKLISDLVQIRLGIKEYATYPAYNLEGSGDKMHSRFLFFEVVNDAVQMGVFPYIKNARYFVMYSEIVETGPLESFGLAPLSALALETSGVLIDQRKEALMYTNKFIKKCQVEMMGHSEPLARGLSPYICNGFIGSLEGCCLIDKHDSATFEYPPPLPGKGSEAIEFLQRKIASKDWFISPSNNRYLLKCCNFPFLCDLHGNPIELKSSTDQFYIVVQCIRPKLCVCPFCGKGEDGEFACSVINETMTKDEILEHGVKNKANVQAIESLELHKHLAHCPIAAKMMKPSGWANGSNGNAGSFSCFACKKKFNDTREWYNHCHQRVCIINTINFLLNGSKRKRVDSENTDVAVDSGKLYSIDGSAKSAGINEAEGKGEVKTSIGDCKRRKKEELQKSK